MPKIATEWQLFEQLSTNVLYEMLRFRQSVFVVEQHSPYPDLDGHDQNAWHLLLRFDGELAGYLRLTPKPGPPPLVAIGRVAVASYLRHRGFGRMLLERALLFCSERYAAQPIVLAAQTHLVPFYEGLGFAATSEPYDDFGVAHVEMRIRPQS